MRALTAAEMFAVWDLGQPLDAPSRALALLAAACPEASPGALEALSVGERDRRLLTLREWFFGPRLVSLAECPACGERVESSFFVADVREPAPAASPGPGPFELDAAGLRVRFR